MESSRTGGHSLVYVSTGFGASASFSWLFVTLKQDKDKLLVNLFVRLLEFNLVKWLLVFY